MKNLTLKILVEDEQGMVWAHKEIGLDFSVNQEGKMLFGHPNKDDAVYNIINEAEDAINNWDNPKF